MFNILDWVGSKKNTVSTFPHFCLNSLLLCQDWIACLMRLYHCETRFTMVFHFSCRFPQIRSNEYEFTVRFLVFHHHITTVFWQTYSEISLPHYVFITLFFTSLFSILILDLIASLFLYHTSVPHDEWHSVFTLGIR